MKKKILFEIDEDFYKQCKLYCINNSISFRQFANEALKAKLDSIKKQTKNEE